MGSDLAHRPSENAPTNCDSSESDRSNDSPSIRGVWKSGSNCDGKKKRQVSRKVSCAHKSKKKRKREQMTGQGLRRFKQDSELGLGELGKTCGHPRGMNRDKSPEGGPYQNTVCLRISQLEDVATNATRQNLLKRMTGNLFQTIVGRKARARMECPPRQNERQDEADVSLTKMAATKGLESPSRIESPRLELGTAGCRNRLRSRL